MTSSIASTNPVIRLDAVTHHFVDGRARLTALHDVTLDVQRGERLALVGESGAGKSTLLRTMNLLVRPASGRVTLDGSELTALGEAELAVARRNVAMVFQHFALLHRRTVRENVALPLELAGVPRAERNRRVDELLERVSLLDKADAWPSQLSGGQRQRAGIARALVHNPRVLLCDEATSALDTRTAQQVVDLLAALSAERDLTIVFVTHQLEVVRRLADRVAVLDRGEVCEVTPVNQLFTLPRSTAGRRLIEPTRGGAAAGALFTEARGRAGIGPSTLLTIHLRPETPRGVVFALLGGHFGLSVDIVGASIEPLGGAALGPLSLLVTGDVAAIHEAVRALEEQLVEVEVIGHVARAA